MRRFRRGELHSGKGGKVVTDPKQAQAIALSACGQSKYSEILQSMGFPASTAEEVVAIFAESLVKSSKHSASSSSFEEPDWKRQFDTGKGPGPEKEDNYKTGMTKKKGRGQLKIGKGPGDGWKQKDNESEMLSPVAYPKGPGNPQGDSSKEVFGMRAFAEDLLGECDQKKKREARKGQRTAEQLQGDKDRSQALRGKDTMPSASRSEAAKKSAATRAKCKGGQPQQPTTP